MELEAYTFVLLRRGPRAADFADDQHETKRGFCVYRTGLEETRRLTAQNPAIRAGRVAAEVMTWLTRKGALG